MTDTEYSPTATNMINNETLTPQLSVDYQVLNLDDLLYLTKNQHNLIDFLQSQNLLTASQTCKCHKEMDMKPSRTNDLFQWQCPGGSCGNTFSIRRGSFFSGSKINLKELVTFLYLWAYKMTSYKTLKRECRMTSAITIRDWRMLIRDVCVEHFLRHPEIIGGKGCRVEIEESLFPRRRSKVKRIIKQQLIFGGYEEATNKGFLVAVPSRYAMVLIALIKEFIRPGTTIISGCWRPEDRLGLEGYQLLRRTHGCTFMDPAHVDSETLWQDAKKERDKTEFGAHGKTANAYLAEFMWRQKFKTSPLEIIFQHIAEMYPV